MRQSDAPQALEAIQHLTGDAFVTEKTENFRRELADHLRAHTQRTECLGDTLHAGNIAQHGRRHTTAFSAAKQGLIFPR